MTMWTRKYSNAYSGITKEMVWQMWVDVDHYTDWHGDLDYCKLQGSFEVGQYFLLKPKGTPAVKVHITELIPNNRFVDCTHFLGARMYDIHEVGETVDGVTISNTIQVTGILAWLWVKLVAKHVAATIPQDLDALVSIARRRYG